MSSTSTPTTSRRWLTLWPVGLALLALVLLGLVGWVGWRGYLEGLALREERQRQAAAIHLSRADALAGVGDTDLAEQELVEALRLAPDYPAAQERLTRLHEQDAMAPPRSPNAISTVPPTSTPLPTPTPTPSPADLLAAAQRAEAQSDWPTAIALLDSLRGRAPDYASDVVKDGLLRAYLADGYALVAQDQLDRAIQRFDAALQLAPDNLEAAEQRELARQYLQAMSSWDQDWEVTGAKFEELYQRAPEYKDVTQRLALVYVIQGDRALDKRFACDAAEAYARALVVVDQPDTRAKLARARQACYPARLPTPTLAPAPHLNPRLVLTQDAPGPNGQLAGRVLDRQGRPFRGYTVTLEAGSDYRQTTTNASGLFEFDNLPPAEYTVDVPAGIGPSLEVRVEPGKQVVVEFVEP
ncbi:MAG: carboxypeptidase regulatory-like domain-containing protein [Anaerolineae bacterium]|nr:carboxypeptidase regulatory-like domain-containing protein [Anaerolineae bacterium]